MQQNSIYLIGYVASILVLKLRYDRNALKEVTAK